MEVELTHLNFLCVTILFTKCLSLSSYTTKKGHVTLSGWQLSSHNADLIKDHIFNHFISNDLFTAHQQGFMPGKSCVTQLLYVMQEYITTLPSP